MIKPDKLKQFICSYQMILLSDIIALIVLFIYSGVLIIDEMEHLHASYFITQGYLPYRDFFEHHHPLFLFLLTPLVAFLPQNSVLVLYASRLLMTLFSVGTFYYIYKIANRFLGGKFCALLGILIFASFYPTLYMFSIVKPDTVMHFFFVCGLYYFFEYCHTLKTNSLIISAAALTLSFLFLQTAVFFILPVCLIALHIIIKHPEQIKNFLSASILPTIFIGCFILYLWLTSSLKIYIQSGWIFNSKFFSLLNFRLPSVLPDFFIYILFGYMAYGYLVWQKKANFYIHSLIILLSFALLKNIVYTAYYPRYLLPCFFYASLLIAAALCNAPQKAHIYLKAALFLIFLINITITFTMYNNRNSLEVLNKIKPEDTCFNYFCNEQNIYQPYFSYYWYAHSIAAVDDYLFNRLPDYNLTELLKSVKFKYILYNQEVYQRTVPVPRESSNEEFKATYQRHTMDNDVLKDYDLLTVGNVSVYKRKE